ncbi:hypothetical protein HYT00_00750 [Candidatus Giovannonibacteria bacterium]|nr:hypothetical protein [Candidatus Giovannonibacteria bacterium]
MKAYIFDKEEKYLGSFLKDENLGGNFLIKRLVSGPVSLMRDEGGTILSEEITADDENYFWAVVGNLRSGNYRVFIFEEEREKIAEMLLNPNLDDKERFEFFTSLLSVPEEELTVIKEGIAQDLNDLG